MIILLGLSCKLFNRVFAADQPTTNCINTQPLPNPIFHYYNYFISETTMSILPSLRKITDRDYTLPDNKPNHQSRDISQYEPRKQTLREQSRPSSKVKIGGGFRLSNTSENLQKYDSYKIEQYISQTKAFNQIHNKKSTTDINNEIRLLDRKIRQCQRKIQEEKKIKLQEDRRAQENRYDQDFQQVIKRELQLHGYSHPQQENKNFDYLTNPGGPPQQQPTVEEPPLEPEAEEPYSIAEGIEKLQRFYENSLKKKFERREIFPHKACRRKTPKLYITQKTNALSKQGKPLSQQQHRFRVMTKETTPQQIYPVIPNFAVVKDTLSKNIVAYLGDYRPFIDKTKEKVQSEIKKEQDLAVENANNTISVSN